MSTTICAICVIKSEKVIWGSLVGLTGGITSILESASVPWSPLIRSRITGSDMVANDLDGADEVVGGSGSVRGGEIRMFMNSEGSMGG